MKWKTSKDLMQSAESVYCQLKEGKIKVDEAKAMGAQIRTAAKVVAMEMEFSRMSGDKITNGKLRPISLE